MGSSEDDPTHVAEPIVVTVNTDADPKRGDAENSLLADGRTVVSSRSVTPEALDETEWWVNWVRAYRLIAPEDSDSGEWEIDTDGVATKQPVAPYDKAHAKPVKWRHDLPEEEHPATVPEDVKRWSGIKLGIDIRKPDQVASDTLRPGVILPVDRKQKNPDGITIIDWDDVRNPETGETHPVVIEAIRELGGYVAISQSGEGLHQWVYGDIPDGSRKFIRHIDDEPFVGDDLPQVEIYTSGRLVAMTGKHVEGTGLDIVDGQDLIDRLCWEYGTGSNAGPGTPTDPYGRNVPDASGPVDDGDSDVPSTADVGEAMRETIAYRGADPVEWKIPENDPRSLDYHAVLRARERSDELTTTANWELIGYAAALGYDDGLTKEQVIEDLKAHPVPEHGYRPQKSKPEVRSVFRKAENGNYAPPSRDTLVDRGILPDRYSSDAKCVAPVPLDRLGELNDDDAWKYLQRRGIEWPDTSEARDRLRQAVMDVMRNEDERIIIGLTSLGKSHTVATEPWLHHADVTGDAPVIHLSPTKEARDENAEKSRKTGLSVQRLRGRTDACPVAAGRTDITINDTPAEDWIHHQCEGKGLPFSLVHAYADEYHDGNCDLPCSEGDAECPAIAQWNGIPWDEDGGPAVDIIHATHPFAYVPSVRTGTNLIIDESPQSFEVEMGRDRLRRTVGAYLDAIDAPVSTYDGLVTLANASGGGDIASERDALEALLDAEAQPDREWFITHQDAHALAPDLTRAIYHTLRWEEPDRNNRCSTTVTAEPPRFDEEEEEELISGSFLTVVMDADDEVVSIRNAPNLMRARSVIGLDAHPIEPIWQRNTTPNMEPVQIMNETERRLWRRFERGLTGVQVGDATRPLSSNPAPGSDRDGAREWVESDGKLPVLLETLRDHFGADFRTAITTAQVEQLLEQRLTDAGVRDPATMHYGEEMSRNDFAGERAGFINGCMDPGDDYVINLLAELDAEAWPERVGFDDVDEPENALCSSCDGRTCKRCQYTGFKRAKGRGWEGPDADIAEQILASVRENHVAQAIGRWARNPDDPDDEAIVFVRTDAVPDELIDAYVDGVDWVATDLQRQIIESVAAWSGDDEEDDDAMGATAKGIAEDAGCTPRYVREKLSDLEDRGLVERTPGAGPHPDRWVLAAEATFRDADLGPIDGEDPTRRFSGEKPEQSPTKTSLGGSSGFFGEIVRADGSAEIDAMTRAETNGKREINELSESLTLDTETLQTIEAYTKLGPPPSPAD